MEHCGQIIDIPNHLTPFTIIEVNGVILCSFFGEADLLSLEKRNLVTSFEKESWTTSQNAQQLVEYFNGERQGLNIKMRIPYGTIFQQKVWSAMNEIPYGKTWSYGDVARSVGTRAFRAVGQACKRNPLPIIIPCHRVIASDGNIGGFFGNIELKRKLLAHENYIL